MADEAPTGRTVYTTTAVGLLLGYSDRHVLRMCEDGLFAGAFRRGTSGHWRIPAVAIDAFLAASRPRVRKRV